MTILLIPRHLQIAASAAGVHPPFSLSTAGQQREPSRSSAARRIGTGTQIGSRYGFSNPGLIPAFGSLSPLRSGFTLSSNVWTIKSF
jgi:hypothetical protein